MVARKGPNTYFRGSDPIDGIWITSEIEVTSAAYLPFDPELGDHQPVIANMSKRLLVGDNGPRVQRVACQRLNSKEEERARAKIKGAAADFGEDSVVATLIIKKLCCWRLFGSVN